MVNFSFSPSINFVEEGKWLLAVTGFEATNSVFNIANKKNSFPFSIPGRWRIPNYLEDRSNNKLKNLLKLRSQNNIELQGKEARKKGK